MDWNGTTPSNVAIIYWLFSESNIFAGGRGSFATFEGVVPFQSIWTRPVVFNPMDTRDVLLTRVTWLKITMLFIATLRHTPARLYFWLFSMSQCQDSTDYHWEKNEDFHILCGNLWNPGTDSWKKAKSKDEWVCGEVWQYTGWLLSVMWLLWGVRHVCPWDSIRQDVSRWTEMEQQHQKLRKNHAHLQKYLILKTINKW